MEPPVEGDGWERSRAYLRGVELFNAGYYWEAHEEWEALWHAEGRKGTTADLLKGLIKLAAAGVKVREGQPHGVTTHARRAAALFEAVRAEGARKRLGLDLDRLADEARRVAEAPPSDPGPAGARVTRVFTFRIEPA
jgi:predicted metal-dependent hydrolase